MPPKIEVRVAILAATLFFLKWCPTTVSSSPPNQAFVAQRRKTYKRPRPSVAIPTAATGPMVLIIASRRPLPRGEFGGDYPQAGRFTRKHKTGAPAGSAREGDTAWGAAVAALASSGTLLAYETRPESSAEGQDNDTNKQGEEEGALNNALGILRRPSGQLHREQHQNREQERQRQQLSRPPLRPRSQTMYERASAERGRGPPPEQLLVWREWLRVNLYAGAEAISDWTAVRGERLRQGQLFPRPPLFVREPSLVLLRLQTDIALLIGAGALSTWSSSRGGVVGVVVRDAQAGLEQWTERRAAELSGLTAEAARHAENAFSTVRVAGDAGIKRLLGTRRGSRSEKNRGRQAEEEGEYEGSRLALLTDHTVQNVVDVVARDGWEHVATTSGVVVHRQYIALGPDGVPTPPSSGGTEGVGGGGPSGSGVTAAAVTPGKSVVGGGGGGGDAAASEGANSKAPQFACVKATAVLNVPPGVVYRLFADNSRVGEYNEHCREVMDLETLSDDSKITWAASGRMGPFKARDFCTLVHFRTLSDGTLAHVSRPVEHPGAPRSSKYVRSEILLAGNFMRPVPGDPSRTEFLMITHVNPGGAAETRAGAMLVNSLCASSPVNFIRRLEVAAQKLMLESQGAEESQGIGESQQAEVGQVTGRAETRRIITQPPSPPPRPPPPPQLAEPGRRGEEPGAENGEGGSGGGGGGGGGGRGRGSEWEGYVEHPAPPLMAGADTEGGCSDVVVGGCSDNDSDDRNGGGNMDFNRGDIVVEGKLFGDGGGDNGGGPLS